MSDYAFTQLIAANICRQAFDSKKQIMLYDLVSKIENEYDYSFFYPYFNDFNPLKKALLSCANDLGLHANQNPLGSDQKQYTFINFETFTKELLSDMFIDDFLKDNDYEKLDVDLFNQECQNFVDKYFDNTKQDVIDLNQLLNQIQQELASHESNWHGDAQQLIQIGKIYDAFPSLKAIGHNITPIDELIDKLKKLIPNTLARNAYYPTFQGTTNNVIAFSKLCQALNLEDKFQEAQTKI